MVKKGGNDFWEKIKGHLFFLEKKGGSKISDSRAGVPG